MSEGTIIASEGPTPPVGGVTPGHRRNAIVGLAVMLIFFTTSILVAMVGFGIMVASASAFVVSIRRRTMGPGAGGFSPDAWIDRLRSKWRR